MASDDDKKDGGGDAAAPVARARGKGLNPLEINPETGRRRGGPGRAKGSTRRPDKQHVTRPSLTPEKVEKFLANLEDTPMVRAAAVKAGAPLQAFYKLRDKDPDFAARWEKSLSMGMGVLEDELVRRAYKGVREPIFYKGEEVATVTKYSDTLLMFALKAVKPEKYREPKADDGEKDKSGYVVITKDDERL